MDQLNQLLQQMPATGQTAFASMGEQSATAAQAVGINMQQIPTQAQTTFQQLPPMAQQGTDAMVQEFSQLATKCQPGADAFIQASDTWGQQAYENIANWADQMAQVVVDRLSQAWAQISAQFSAGLNVNVTTSAPNVAHNALGGIYNKGMFLTTFAEDGPEAAIPLDGSKRAISLWNKAGEILGLLPKDSGVNMRMAEQARSIALPPIMNTVEALPPDIGMISDILAPPTEAQIAAAPVALEPTSQVSSFEVNFSPQITINGNADSNTVSQMSNELSRLKAELMRELRREFGSMVADYKHNERRTSLAT